jgi:hypothetical protein
MVVWLIPEPPSASFSSDVLNGLRPTATLAERSRPMVAAPP